MLDSRLETFLDLCETMNYTRTASRLYITQPAVTQQIKFLEKKYNTKLFNYIGKNLTLTESGEELRKLATQMRVNSLKSIKKISNIANSKKCINIGATNTINNCIMPEIIKNYIESQPKIALSYYTDNTKALLTMLEQGEIDCALIEGFFNRSEYDCKLLKRVKFCGVCSTQNHLANKTISPIDLINETLIIQEKGSGTRDITKQLLEEHNLSINDFSKVIEISELSLINELIKDNIGISFEYEPAVLKLIAQGKFREIKIKDFSVTREFNFVYMHNSLFEDDLIEFYNFCMNSDYFKKPSHKQA